MRVFTLCLILVLLATGCSSRDAGAYRGVIMHAYRGTTAVLDGIISPGEYDDATSFKGVKKWFHEFNPTTNDGDLSLQGWIKHDGKNLYLALSITDDILYGIDIERWLPDDNPKAHELSPKGWPWFGDEAEILMYPQYQWNGRKPIAIAGDGSSWQMVCNLTKSRLGGIGVGGLLAGEPRTKSSAWNTYRKWIETGAMEAVAKVRPGGKGYVIEWKIKANPCLEVRPGVFWSPKLGKVEMGFNIAVGDLDEKQKGRGNFGNFNHEDWWAGKAIADTNFCELGILVICPGTKSN